MSRTTTLASARRTWFSRTSPRLLACGLSASLALRVLEGGFGVRDLVVAGAFVVLQPFTEWLIHVYVLHWRPRTIRGRLVDPYAARSHRRHHEDPRNLDHLLIEPRVVVAGLAVNALLHVLAFTVRPAFGTAAVVTIALTAAYEWTHFLIHTDYVPRTRFYRGLWRAHRLHHFRNENYWFGVTGHVGDRVLGTYPGKADVPLSPTATRLLGA